MSKKEKWKVISGNGDAGRYVVNQKYELIADCYANTYDNLGLLDQSVAKRNARRIALLPQMEDMLRAVQETLPLGSRLLKVNELLNKLDRAKGVKPARPGDL